MISFPKRGAWTCGIANNPDTPVLGVGDLGIFLDRVSKYSRIINVDNLRMAATPPGSEKTIRATFTATTFVYDEQAATASEGQR